MATILITGIAGFIGSSIARALVAEGAHVRGLDNLSSGSPANLEEIRKQIDFRHADVLDNDEVRAAMKGVDYVFHEAAIPSVPKSVNDPVGTNGPNLTGTLNVLEAARQAGVKRLLYAASSAAYGDNPTLPKTEMMLPEPISPYAVQKVASEHYLASYYKVYGLETVALRYFNVFGPRQDPSSQYSGVLARFISLMLAGEAPTIYGDGLTSRDFVYIDNVVSANLLAAKAPREKVAGKIFNVATGKRTTLLEAFAEVKRITGFMGEVKHEAERNGDIKHSGASIAAAEEAFEYKVIAGLGYGLEKTIAWARESVPVA
ncbi:MAG: SDR family NAD(P)-dependent oxidoreductase [Acidobacteria bacterium]|nr:SDR family NAD(P)-dependent oxidoreductase [Acidobacteriota bacterium]